MTDTTRPPAPRLQFRWEKGDEPDTWDCQYELILPLRAIDIRRAQFAEDEETLIDCDELAVNLGYFSSQLCTAPGERGDFVVPYRGGAHAQWDAEALNGLPIYCVSPSGRYTRDPHSPPA